MKTIQQALLQCCLLMTSAALLTACGGGDSSSSPSTSSGTSAASSSSSSGGGCNYTDLVTASERATINKCDIQVTAAYLQADSLLQGDIAACQQGQKAAADANYNSSYTKAVAFARANATTLSCGSNNGPVLPNNSTQTYANLCVKSVASNGKLSYTGSCLSPFKQGDTGCGSSTDLTFAKQYVNVATCVAEGAAYAASLNR